MTRKNPIAFIKALRTSADIIEANPSVYSWGFHSRCNCGVVANTLLESSGTHTVSDVARNLDWKTMGGRLWYEWARIVQKPDKVCIPDYSGRKCKASNLPFNRLFKTLLKNGFLWTDFKHLEYTSDPIICKRAGLSVVRDGEGASRVVRYLRAWADVLCEKECKIKDKVNVAK